VPAAATDAAQLTSQWMGKIIQRLVELYPHAPWQVGNARTFAIVYLFLVIGFWYARASAPPCAESHHKTTLILC
jgi:hypothetical protein